MMSDSETLDLAQVITRDHDNIRDLFNRFKDAGDTDKVAIGNTLLRDMYIHGEAENTTLYKAMGDEGMAKEAEEDMKDHKNINQLIQQINKCQPCSKEYVDLMKRVVPMFLEHSDKEEQNHLTKLQLSLKDSDERAKAFLKARSNVQMPGDMGAKFASVKNPLPQM
ncbi:hypothetical protein C8Q74DRAFT_82401 [Fomes fomentarius]|nr:hypothetical protein C8Q74DRAFT_82401 [Fomes fomentarius]